MKKFLILSILFYGNFLVANDPKRARPDSSSGSERSDAPSLLNKEELTLDYLQDQCVQLLSDIRKVGYTRYTEKDIDALNSVEEAGDLAEKLDLIYVDALRKYYLKKSKPKKKLQWKAEDKQGLEAICIIPSREDVTFNLENSEHYTIQRDPFSRRHYYMTDSEVEHNTAKSREARRAAREQGVRFDHQDIDVELKNEEALKEDNDNLQRCNNQLRYHFSRNDNGFTIEREEY